MTFAEAKSMAVGYVNKHGIPTRVTSAYMPVVAGLVVHQGMPNQISSGNVYESPTYGQQRVEAIFVSGHGLHGPDDVSMVLVDKYGEQHRAVTGSALYLESWTEASSAMGSARAEAQPEPKKKVETDKEREMRFFNTSAHDTTSPWWQHWEADGDDWIG